MSEHGHTRPDIEPVTDQVHHNSWSVNLQKPIHGERRSAVITCAIEAVEHTAQALM